MRDEMYIAENVRILNLVSQAYGIKQDLIFGMPGWANDAHYDVQAKLSSEDAEAMSKMSREDKNAATQALLRGMLEERFHLKAHIETRQLPVYDLVIAKGGVKMKATRAGDPAAVKGADGRALRGLVRFQDGMITDQGIEMSAFIGQLTNMVHRAVRDKTGLQGGFDFTLKYAPDRDGPPDPAGGVPQDDAPSIFAALEEQLGLKLQPDKGPVATVVIDHVEQPSEN